MRRLLPLLLLVACNSKESGGDARPSPDLGLRERPAFELHLSERNLVIESPARDAAGKTSWIESPFASMGFGPSRALKSQAGALGAWAEEEGVRVLARTRVGEELVELQRTTDGSVVIARFAATPTRTPLAGLAVKDTTFADLPDSWEGACDGSDPYLSIPDYGVPTFQLAPADGGGWLVIVATCSVVEARRYDASGAALSATKIYDRDFRADRFYIYAPIDARLVGRTVFVDGDDGSIFATLAADGTVAAQWTYAVGETDEIHGFAAYGDVLALAGSRAQPIAGVPNDTRDDDGWLALVDAATGTLRSETTFHHLREDHFHSVAFSSDGATLYAVGDTDRHHVDSGSWDGGSQALLVRYAADGLVEKERLVFGDGRMDIATDLVVTDDALVVSGIWDRIPNNHLPAEEDWRRGFLAILPRDGWENGLRSSDTP